jgi:hypothetical protein
MNYQPLNHMKMIKTNVDISFTRSVVPSKPVQGNSARRLAHAHEAKEHNNTVAAFCCLVDKYVIKTFHCYAK